MTDSEKVILYDLYRKIIHPLIKSNESTKPLWRRLYWTTGKNSQEYKSGCIDIFKEYFPELFNNLK